MQQVNETQHESVVGALYDAATGTQSWHHALHGLLDWCGADAAMLVTTHGERRQLLVAAGYGDEYLNAYRDQWLSVDPRLPAAAGEGADARDELLRQVHAFEQDHGFSCSFGDRLTDTGLTVGWLLLSIRDPAARTRVAIRYGRLRQHLERALLFSRRHANQARHGAALAEMADELPLGVLLMEPSGEVRHANTLAREVLERGDALQLRNGRLRAVRNSDDSRLRQAIEEASSRQPAKHAGSRWLALPRRGGELPYTLAVRCSDLAPVGNRMDGTAPLLRVVIGDSTHVPVACASVLSALFGLTNREGQVCTPLLGGLCIDELATDLGVSPRTARVYLQQVFTKTGVHRQADLVRVLLGCPAVLGTAPGKRAPTTHDERSERLVAHPSTPLQRFTPPAA